MNTPIKLQRDLVLQGWRVTGTIAFATRREWEPALLKLAVQHGAVTPEIVVRDLLGGRAGVARRLLDICARLGLLELQRQIWVPTAAGHETARSGLVMVPERGTWTLWACEDSLLQSPIVAVQPWREPSAYDERSKDTQRPIIKLPPSLTAAVGRPCAPIAGEHRAMRVDDLGKEQKGEAVGEERTLPITLSLSTSDVRLRVTGSLEGARVDADLPPPAITYEATWETLLGQAGLWPRWDPYRRALCVGFDDATLSERSSMERVVRFDCPDLPGLGRFKAAAVDHVPLRPWSKTDAAAWAEWRLLQGIKDHVIGDVLAEAYRDAVAPFADIAPQCPTRATLAERARGADRPPATYWRLQAPADWSLEGRDVR